MKKPILLLTAVTAGLSLAQAPLQAEAAPCFSVIQIGPESLCQSNCAGNNSNFCSSAPQLDINGLLNQLGLSGYCNISDYRDNSCDNSDCGNNDCGAADCVDTDCVDTNCVDADCGDNDCRNNNCGNNNCGNPLTDYLSNVRQWSNCTPQISFWQPQTPITQKPAPQVDETPSAEESHVETPSREDLSGEIPSSGVPSVEAPTVEAPTIENPPVEKPSGEVPSIETPAGGVPAGDQHSGQEPSEATPSAEVTTPEITVPETPAPAASIPETQTPVETPSKPTTPVQETQQDTAGYHAYVLRIVELVNEARAQAGLKPVTLRQDLTAVAQLRAKETVTLFSHTRPNGSSCFTALSEYGVSYRGAGENIAYGQRSPEEVMEGWMNSSGHRANILNARFTSIGVGYYQAANGVKYWSQMFTY